MAPTLRNRTQVERAQRANRRSQGKGKADLIGHSTKRKTRRRRLGFNIPQSPSRTPSPGPPLPSNPQAALLGLPAELRLEIYGHVFSAALIHVHRRDEAKASHANEDGTFRPRFTWTPCRGTNPKCSLFCANPKWSGLCKESVRCTFRPYVREKVNGFNALAATSKFIQNETQGYLLKDATVSIHPHDVKLWLDHLERTAPHLITQLRRITLASPDSYNFSYQNALDEIEIRVPNLEAVGFQGQVNRYTMADPANNYTINPQNRWRQWQMAINLMERFDRNITVAMEGLVWRKPSRWRPQGPDVDEQAVFSIIREGRDVGDDGTSKNFGWEDADVEIVSRTSRLVEAKRNAKWRKWWRNGDTKYFM